MINAKELTCSELETLSRLISLLLGKSEEFGKTHLTLSDAYTYNHIPLAKRLGSKQTFYETVISYMHENKLCLMMFMVMLWLFIGADIQNFSNKIETATIPI